MDGIKLPIHQTKPPLEKDKTSIHTQFFAWLYTMECLLSAKCRNLSIRGNLSPAFLWPNIGMETRVSLNQNMLILGFWVIPIIISIGKKVSISVNFAFL